MSHLPPASRRISRGSHARPGFGLSIVFAVLICAVLAVQVAASLVSGISR